MPWGRSGVRLATVAGLVAMAGVAYPDGGPQVGAKLPTATLLDMAGKPVALSAIQDRVLVLNFWAFWCDTWRAERPQLCELATRQEELGFRLVAVSVDGSWTDVFRHDAGRGAVPFTVLLDSKRALSGAMGVRRVPTLVVLNRRRTVSFVHEAYPGNMKVLAAIRRAAGE